jgi:transposase
LIDPEAVLGLPGFEVTEVSLVGGWVQVTARHTWPVSCAGCHCKELRHRDVRRRRLRHAAQGGRHCELVLETRKWKCLGCGKVFWQRFPGVLPRKRATEVFRRQVAFRHWDGVNRRQLGLRERIGSATVERWFQEFLSRQASERSSSACPRRLGIDEHFFSKKEGYATTFCDLSENRVYDVVLGRSDASLEGFLGQLKDKDKVELVCIDLSTTYRSIARKHFPNARIVADRFHVIRIVNHHFLACWKLLDPEGARNRGLLSLMRRHRENLRSAEQAGRLDQYLGRHPALERVYEFKQNLCRLLLKKNQTPQECRGHIRHLLQAVRELQDSRISPLVQLGETLGSWSEEIATMWRFTKNNGVTEGFHNKMETIKRQAYGFRSFKNYRLRVRVMCG